MGGLKIRCCIFTLLLVETLNLFVVGGSFFFLFDEGCTYVRRSTKEAYSESDGEEQINRQQGSNPVRANSAELHGSDGEFRCGDQMNGDADVADNEE